MSLPRRVAVLTATALSLATTALSAQLTVAERTHGARTSTHAEVLAFIDSLQQHGAKMTVGTLGESPEGKRIPFVILARPLVSTPAQAHATGKPILYVEANIHAGEVEGKEAVQELMRDFTLGYLRPLLDSVVVLFVPIYNTDGNDWMGPNDINRGEQEGPPMEGLRANGQGYDLNRDYVKQDAPETRASLAFITKWDPDLFMDLHTTDGSYHGYALTWSPGLHRRSDRLEHLRVAAALRDESSGDDAGVGAERSHVARQLHAADHVDLRFRAGDDSLRQ
jgi:murein tripeptide amidase MpaA